MIIRKGLLAGATVALFLATAPASQAAKWSFFGLGGGGQETPPAQTVQADANRINQLEAQVRALTGQVETLTHAVQQLQDEMNRMQGKGGKPVAAVPTPDATASAPPLPAPDTSVVQLNPALPPAGADTLDAPSADRPLDLSSLATGVDTGAGASPPAATTDSGVVTTASLGGSGDPRTDYEQAYGLINNGQYDVAATAFRKFLETYPKDDLAPDAQYWLGESLFAHGDYASAAEEFKTGFQAYPKSKRAPDSLLKLGLSMAGLGYRTEACKMYALALKQYPSMANGLRQRVRTEQASAAC